MTDLTGLLAVENVKKIAKKLEQLLLNKEVFITYIIGGSIRHDQILRRVTGVSIYLQRSRIVIQTDGGEMISNDFYLDASTDVLETINEDEVIIIRTQPPSRSLTLTLKK